MCELLQLYPLNISVEDKCCNLSTSLFSLMTWKMGKISLGETEVKLCFNLFNEANYHSSLTGNMQMFPWDVEEVYERKLWAKSVCNFKRKASPVVLKRAYQQHSLAKDKITCHLSFRIDNSANGFWTRSPNIFLYIHSLPS